MHEEPNVPNEGSAGRGLRLRPGPVIAVEPWFMAGDDASWTHDDGWSMRTAGGSRTAHVMHTVAVTYGRPRVLTTLSRAATSPSPGRS
jgi:methionyl aminopeptidase